MSIFIAIDTETDLIAPARLAPRLVCMSTYDGLNTKLFKHEDVKKEIIKILSDVIEKDVFLVGHNIAYDIAVICSWIPEIVDLFFDAYDRGKIVDTQIAEKLLLLYDGILKGYYDETTDKIKYVKADLTLNGLSNKYLNINLDKGEDGYRLKYGTLRDISLSVWPKRALEYAKMDAVSTFRVFMEQISSANSKDTNILCDLPAQTRQHFALHLMSCWGMRTNIEKVKELETDLSKRLERYGNFLLDAGLVRRKKDVLVRDMSILRAMVEESYNYTPPRTSPSSKYPNGQVATSSDVLIMSRNPTLINVSRYIYIQKLLSTYVKKLYSGIETPIQPRVDSLLETGRVSINCNFQTMPRVSGLRECFMPREGHLYVSTDYDSAELRSLAQVLLQTVGFSKLAEVYKNPGADPHTELAAHILGVSVEDAYKLKKCNAPEFKHARQRAKAPNFGFPGGMGVQKFVSNLNADIIKNFVTSEKETFTEKLLSEDEGYTLKNLWLQTWPEMNEYFKYVNSVIGYEGVGRFQTQRSGRIRGGCGFCDGANNGFQSITADGAKDACYELVKKMYSKKLNNVLLGCRLVNFIHDETICEVPETIAQEAAHEIKNTMIEAMQKHTPDILCSASPTIMRRWIKGAESHIDEKGNLTICE